MHVIRNHAFAAARKLEYITKMLCTRDYCMTAVSYTPRLQVVILQKQQYILCVKKLSFVLLGTF